VDDATAELAAAIGERVRAERRSRGWTLEQLAQASGVSRRSAINVEQGVANPSIGTLLRLSDALGMGLPALVEPVHVTPVKVTLQGQGAVLWASATGGCARLVAGSRPPDVLELWDWILGPGDKHTSEAHTALTVEAIQVQEGIVIVQVADESVTLSVGDAASFPGDVAHSYSNPGTGTARFCLAVSEPGVGNSLRTGSANV
jgi:transcriptional regulator with XRE-family HTH domain